MRQVILAFVVQVSLPYGPASRTGKRAFPSASRWYKALASFLLSETRITLRNAWTNGNQKAYTMPISRTT